jgi:Caspase domain
MAENTRVKLPEHNDNGRAAPGVATVVSGLAEPQSKPPDAKVKDAWDKAQIISGFVASVVIAAVGLLINSSIQRAQIHSSEESTRAQLEVTDRNNKAQLTLSERSAEIQKRIQESTLTGQLVESLAGTNTLKKRIAIVALRRSVPPDMYQDVITIVVRSDTDPDVRKTALEQAATLQSAQPGVVQAIIDAAKNSSRPPEERKIASAAAQQIGARSITPSNTLALISSSRSQASYESPQIEGGVFTHFLIKGLSGAAGFGADGSIRLSELGLFVTKSVSEFTHGDQVPMLSVTGTGEEVDPVILGPGARFSKTVVIAVGNSKYHDREMALMYPALNAQQLSEVFKLHGALTYVAENATRANFLTNFQAGLGVADADSLLIFYYSGHAIVDRDGMFWLLPVDGDPASPAITGISTSEIKQRLTLTPARTRLLFIDTAFAGNLLESP